MQISESLIFKMSKQISNILGFFQKGEAIVYIDTAKIK